MTFMSFCLFFIVIMEARKPGRPSSTNLDGGKKKKRKRRKKVSSGSITLCE